MSIFGQTTLSQFQKEALIAAQQRAALNTGFASKPKIIRYSKGDFIKEFLYGLPLEKVQELIKEHYPELTI